MDTRIPSAEEVRVALEGLTLKQLDRLAELSGVPCTTIYKIKRGETKNPGIETLRQFMPHVAAAHLIGAEPAKAAAT
jgi:predicted transcriptional regulator